MDLKRIKKISKQINKGRYKNTSALLCISLIITGIFSITPIFVIRIYRADFTLRLLTFLLICIVFYMVQFVFSIGETAWYTGRSTKKTNNYARFIYWLKPGYAFKAIVIKTILLIIKLGITLALISPGMLAIYFAIILAFTGGIEAAVFLSLITGGVVLCITGLIFSFLFNQRYFLTKYLLTENPNLTVIRTIKQSRNLTEGHIFEIAKFKLSFMPLFLLSFMILPLIYIYPHYKQSSCIVAKLLRL